MILWLCFRCIKNETNLCTKFFISVAIIRKFDKTAKKNSCKKLWGKHENSVSTYLILILNKIQVRLRDRWHEHFHQNYVRIYRFFWSFKNETKLKLYNSFHFNAVKSIRYHCNFDRCTLVGVLVLGSSKFNVKPHFPKIDF